MTKLQVTVLLGFVALFVSCNWFSFPEEETISSNSKLKLLWEIPYEPVGTSIYAMPLVLGDSLVIMSAGKEIFAVKQNTGEIKWKYFVSETARLLSSDILYGNNKIYMSHLNDIRSVNILDGSEAWLTFFDNERGNFSSNFKAIKDNKLFVPGLKTIYCLDINDGSILWSNKIISRGQLGSVIYYNSKIVVSSALAIYDSNGIDIGTEGTLHWLDANTGDTLFSKSIIGGSCFKYLTLDNNTGIFYGGTYFTEGGASFEAREAETGDVIWSYYTPNASWSYEMCAVADNKVFVNLTLYGTAAFDKNSGKLLWRKTYSNSLVFPHSMPILYKNYLYVVHGFKLYVINPETGDEIYSYEPPDDQFGTFNIANDKIFITGYNKLQCYETFKGK